MKKLWVVGIVCAAMAMVSSCRHGQPAGSITGQGYRHGVYDYGLMPRSDGQLVPNGWQLDNYFTERQRVRKAGGSPAWQQVLTPKDGPDYKTEYQLDLTGSGEFDADEEAYLYDLRFTHSVHAGVIWMMTVPVPVRWQNKDLSVLTREYVDDISGSGFEIVEYKAMRVEGREKTFASTIVETAAGTVAGREAYAATVDVANLDQLRLNPNHRHRRARVVLIRSGLVYVYTHRSKKYTFPVVLFLGYSNRPAEFPHGLPAFEDFVDRVVIAGQSGAALQFQSAVPEPAAVAAPAPPPEATAPAAPAWAAPPAAPAPAPSGVVPP